MNQLSVSATETAESEMQQFSKIYFGKPMSELTKEENHELDCFGAYGISEYLIDYKEGKLND